jgi:adenylate cyclase
MPLATVILTAVLAFALNMVYGYFVESKSKRGLAALFSTYVPPELVDEMLKEPENYSMEATSRELTVMFCDMRGFTAMSERMAPLQLQALLNDVFSKLTHIIRGHRGTIDKYMGDCVMAFWGAPVSTPDHAIAQINEGHRQRGLPEIGVGIGLNTGMMCVGDMGSDIRRSYTVIGDAVNLGSRLEGLSKHYGTSIVVSANTQRLAPQFAWQQLDLVRVKGKGQAVAIYRPLCKVEALTESHAKELRIWSQFLAAYKAQDWAQCEYWQLRFRAYSPDSVLYRLYGDRVTHLRNQPCVANWDGATNFDSK